MGIVRHRSQDSGDAERAMKTNPNQSLRRLRLRLERGRGLRCEDLKSDIQNLNYGRICSEVEGTEPRLYGWRP